MLQASVFLSGWAGIVDVRRDDHFLFLIDSMEYSHMVDLFELCGISSVKVLRCNNICGKEYDTFWNNAVSFFKENSPNTISYIFD